MIKNAMKIQRVYEVVISQVLNVETFVVRRVKLKIHIDNMVFL